MDSTIQIDTIKFKWSIIHYTRYILRATGRSLKIDIYTRFFL